MRFVRPTKHGITEIGRVLLAWTLAWSMAMMGVPQDLAAARLLPKAPSTAAVPALLDENPHLALALNTSTSSLPAVRLAPPMAMPQAITNAAVKPVLECVVNNGGGSYTAWFGYQNLNSVAVTIPVGSNNQFTPTLIDRGQATVFQPGRQHSVFSVNFNGSNLVWYLKGPDNSGRTYTAASNSTLCATNHPPVANAGPNQTVFVGTTVQLNGSGSSDPDGNPITYLWSFVSMPSGSNATLSSTTTVNPTFVVDKPGSYVIQLIVNDGQLDSAPSQVTIRTQNSPPVANAGLNQTVTTGTTVRLDGSKSTEVDGNALTYQWSFVSVPTGSTATLSNPTAINPTFVADKKGNYVVQLIVNDGSVDSTPSQVTISDVNSPPVANAGPAQIVHVPELEAGFHLLYELKPAEAHVQFEIWEKAHLEDPLGSASQAASYLFEECYRQGILTSEFFLDNKRFLGKIPLKPNPELRAAFFAADKQAQNLARLRLKTNPDDTNALFAMALSAGMQADYASLIDKHQVESLKMIRDADKYANRLLTVAPDAADAYLGLGTANYIIGSLPALKRFFLGFAGIHGDKRRGIQQLEIAAARGHYLRPFAKILLAMAALREKKTEVARIQLKELVAEFPENPLFASELAKLKVPSAAALLPEE
jgi:hypothetical protein